MRAGQMEVDNLSRELRYTQQTVAMELAGWQDMHERMGRKAIRELARGMVVVEKMRLEGMRRALRRLQNIKVDRIDTETGTGVVSSEDDTTGGSEARGFSNLGAPIVMAGLEMQADRKADSSSEPTTTFQNSTATPPGANGSRIEAPLPALPPGETTEP